MSTRITEEQKATVVEEYKKGVSLEKLMRKYHIAQSTAYKLVQGYRQTITVDGQQLFAQDVAAILRENKRLKMENALLLNTRCSVHSSLDEKLPEMIRLKEETGSDLHTLCRVFGVLRSTYYHRVLRSPIKTQLEIEDEKIKPVIRQLFFESRERFGSKMIKAKMDSMGYRVGQNRIIRLMREMDLRCNTLKKALPEYRRQYTKDIYYTGNKLKRNFYQDEPNHIWTSDITYLRTMERMCYLCVIIDLFSRKIIGHMVSDNEEVGIVLDALNEAVKHRTISPKLIFHSDQGSQYRATKFRDKLKELGIKQSYSEPGTPYDNAVAESFFAGLKKEEIYQYIYQNQAEVTQAVDEYIHFFNSERPHRRLGMRTPDEVERQFNSNKK